MNNLDNSKLEYRIKKAVEEETPDVLDSIMLRCKTIKKGVDGNMKKSIFSLKNLGILAASLVLVFSAFAMKDRLVNKPSDMKKYEASSKDTNEKKTENEENLIDETKGQTIVMLDLNPRIELRVDDKDVVKFVKAHNDDAKKVLMDMKLENSNLNVAVNAIVGSMLKNGYLDDFNEAILVSVENEDIKKSMEVEKKLVDAVNSAIVKKSLDAKVMSQIVSEDDDVREIVEKYNVSVGKALLIEEISDNYTGKSIEELSKMSISELNEIAYKNKIKLRRTNIVENKPSVDLNLRKNKTYISVDEAKEIVLKKAGVNYSDAYRFNIEFDNDDSMLKYEIEFWANGIEYEFEIDAKTGRILDVEAETSDFVKSDDIQEIDSSIKNFKGIMKPKEALEIAMKHSKLDNRDGIRLEDIDIELDDDDNRLIYEVEYKANGVEYEYKIDASTGKILKSDKDFDEEDNAKNTSTIKISKEEAKAIAQKHSGVKNLRLKKLELDEDGNRYVYEMEFISGKNEYEYEIDSKTGKIIKFEVSKDDDYDDDDDNDDDNDDYDDNDDDDDDSDD